jgi:hypothetical protein
MDIFGSFTSGRAVPALRIRDWISPSRELNPHSSVDILTHSHYTIWAILRYLRGDFITISPAKTCVARCKDCSVSAQQRCALPPGHSIEPKAQWRCNWRPCAPRRLQVAVPDQQHRWRTSEHMRRYKLLTSATLIMQYSLINPGA